MPITTPRALLAIWLFCGAAATNTFAAGGSGEYQLPWKGPQQVLAYRSCGCGDSCWVAEVRDAQSQAVKLRLRCDCEQLFVSQADRSSTERPLAQSCAAINQAADKPTAIRQTLEQLLHGASSAP